MTEDATLAAVAALGTALADLYRVLRRSTTRRLGRPPLPDAQVEVLRLVERCPGISVKEAAERLGSAANTVSTLVGDLADAGLLERSRDPRNRRMVRLRLTPAAYDRIAKVTADRRDLLLAALDRLDEPARQDLLRAGPHLRRLVDLVVERERGEVARSAERDGTGGAEDQLPVVPDLTGGRPVRPRRGEG
ncbi:MarR family winged helix-turn-helix transcriptional regulator [Micromonospora sp. HM5-17]|jgi:DNA-binding MarR family transcriptional regulator|uniref:MarR family winged helix-turn-helix transcriptional regulator n=1 Tax=Micromonospora sp. HM5-17 TaxID=2487710 RepID=UPI000F46757B|nr:MarR family transcriptional regulator [Micromonospora sp. HM5-17]